VSRHPQNPNPAEQRRKILVDSDIQGALLRQMAVSWLTVIGVIAAVLLAVESYKAGFTLDLWGCMAAMWQHNSALVIASGILAPFIVYDSIKLSHRFVGPMISFRRALTRLGNGEKVGALRFRQDDFWQDLADRFNVVVERMDYLEAARADDRPEQDLVEATKTSPVSPA